MVGCCGGGGCAVNVTTMSSLRLRLGLGVDNGSQRVSLARWAAGGRHAGSDAAEGGNSTPRAILLSALTTVASFGSLSISQHPGTASMGQLLTIAILLTLVCVLTFLPALLALTGRLPRACRAGREPPGELGRASCRERVC